MSSPILRSPWASAPDGKIYYASNRGIYQANEDDHKNVGYIDSIPENAYNETMLKIFPLSDACYVWVNGNEYIECIEYAQKNKTNSVLVVDAPFYIPAAMSIYEESGNRIDFRDQACFLRAVPDHDAIRRQALSMYIV